MIELGVNIDHVVTLRNVRHAAVPDPVSAAVLAEFSGANGITVHLREDRRHINDTDLRRLRETVWTKLNLEMSLNPKIVETACAVVPDQATLVLEKRREITTEGGLDVCAEESRVKETIARLHEKGIRVSLFLDPEEKQIEAAKRCGSDAVELHTGKYADAETEEARWCELARLIVAGKLIDDLGMRLHAGHGLNYRNVLPVAAIPHMAELNIGHGIIARAVLFGLQQAIKEIKQITGQAQGEMMKELNTNPYHTRALARWIKAGRPVRTPDEVQKIYEVCKKCSIFDKAANICKHCGCRVAGHANPLMNKIAIGTERCPLGKWPGRQCISSDAEPYE